MNSKSANVFESFGSLVQFYPKLCASIALDVMTSAAKSMGAFGTVSDKSVELVEAKSPSSLAIPARARSIRPSRKNRATSRKSVKRSTRRRKAA